MRVVPESARGHGEGVTGICPGRVRRRRQRHALIVRAVRRELRDQPALRRLVEDHDRIAAVLRLAGAAEPRPERVDVRRAENRSRDVGGVVERPDLITRVDRFDELVAAHRAVAVGRCAAVDAYPVEIEPQRRCGEGEVACREGIGGRDHALDDRVGDVGTNEAPVRQLRIGRRLVFRRLLPRGDGGQLNERPRDVEVRRRDRIDGLPQLVLVFRDRVEFRAAVVRVPWIRPDCHACRASRGRSMVRLLPRLRGGLLRVTRERDGAVGRSEACHEKSGRHNFGATDQTKLPQGLS